MKGRTPVVSPTAAKEFMKGSSAQRDKLGSSLARTENKKILKIFLTDNNGRLGAPSTAIGRAVAEADGAKRTARNIKAKSAGDPGVMSSTRNDGINLLTQDKRLLRDFDNTEKF